MNKYQEALNNLIINSCLVAIGSKEPCSSCKYNKICNTLARGWIDTLQELMDKETPMKPLEDNYLGEFMCECGSPITKDYKYCPNCGQKLNWNKKEPCSSCKYNKICGVKK